jgi:protein-arginine kinase activator protein McsA
MTIKKEIHDIASHLRTEHDKAVGELLRIDEQIFKDDPAKLIREKNKQMEEAVKILDFETAAILRDEIQAIEKRLSTDSRKKPKNV